MRTVVIVEPHPLFRLGLRQLLTDALPLTTVEGYDYSVFESTQASSTQSCDLLLLSLNAKEEVPTKAIEKAAERFNPKRILLLAGSADVQAIASQLPASVAGSVCKESPPEILQASVSLVLAGGTCFPAGTVVQRAEPAASTQPVSISAPGRYEPVKWSSAAAQAAPISGTTAVPVSRAATADSDECEFATPMRPGSAAHRESQLLGLTPRQYEVLVLLARGYPMKKVGRALNISVATAKAHTETLYQRLDVHNRNAAVYAAVSRGATLGWANVPNIPNQK